MSSPSEPRPEAAPSPDRAGQRARIAAEKAAAGLRRHRDDRVLPRINSFQFRRGTLRPGQQRLWEEQWPRLGRDADREVLDPAAWFGRTAPVVLEIGCGTGTATAAMATAEPAVDIIAVEVYRPGLAQLLGLVVRGGNTNVRMIMGDGVDVLENMIAPDSLTGIRVFFPDPWPKARHHKRRLLQPGVFALMRSRLRPGGVLHIATDHSEYAEWIALTGDQAAGLRTLDETEYDRVPFSRERPVTKFEDKGLRKDHAISEFFWMRID